MKILTHFLVLTLLLPSFVFSQTENTLDSVYSNPTNLSDEDMARARDFKHQGIIDQYVKDKCESKEAKDQGACVNEDGFPLEMLIGKAYAAMGMMMGTSGGVPTLATTSDAYEAAAKSAEEAQKLAETGPEALKKAEEAQKAADAKKPEDQVDYCMIAAMTYETVGGIIQQALQKQSDNTTKPGDEQLQSLISMEEAHIARRTTAYWQAGIYGAIFLCYGAMMLTDVKKSDPRFIAKMAGAGALAGLYVLKGHKHNIAKQTVRAIINQFPEGNDCNPWTKTSCFCSEKTSKERYPGEYQKVCVLNKGNFDTPIVAMGCVASNSGNQLSYDKECNCKKTNTCVRTKVEMTSPDFQLSSNLMNEANKTFDMANSGMFDQAKFAAATTANRAVASKLQAQLDTDVFPKPNLTAEEKKLAAELSKYMPASLAAVAAGSKSEYKGGIQDSAAASVSMKKLNDLSKQNRVTGVKARYQTGSGFGGSKKNQPAFTMPKFGVAKPEAAGSEVVSFAEQAMNNADVSNAPDTPIFDIISHRYRQSGWRKLEPEEERK